jgi:integrase
MAKRRAKGEGALWFSQSENCWIAEVILPDGKTRRKRNKKQSIVRDWLHEQRQSIKTNTIVESEPYTVKSYFARYLESAEVDLKPKTVYSYNWLSDKHIIPEIGHIKLTTLSSKHLDDLYAKKRSEGLSERSLQYIHALIRVILNQAVRQNLILRNPTATVSRVPKPKKRYVEPLTVEQVHKLFKAIEFDRLKALWMVAIGTGLRLGEILALTWQCINLDEGYLEVKQNLVEVRGKGLIFGEPKSEKSRRVVGLPDFALDALKSHPKASDTLVFATKNGTPFSPRNTLRHFKKILKDAGIPETTRIHDLRHTFISHLLAANEPPKNVQEIAGHSTFSTTMDIYGHLLPGVNTEAAKKIGKIFG